MIDNVDSVVDVAVEHLADLDTVQDVLEALHLAFEAGDFFQFERAKRFARSLEDALGGLYSGEILALADVLSAQEER